MVLWDLHPELDPTLTSTPIPETPPFTGPSIASAEARARERRVPSGSDCDYCGAPAVEAFQPHTAKRARQG
jgi:hypothetical protein